MPARKRKRRERTHNWQEIQQSTLWPEQEVYERLRPIVLFGETAAERAKETGVSPRTLHYQARLFEQEGMASLFHKERGEPPAPGRKLSHHTVQRVLADGPEVTVTTRRYPPYTQIADPYQRRRAIVDLHAEGWSHTAISAYLQTPRHRVYEVLNRWATEGYAGLDDRPSSAPHHPARKVTIYEINEVRKLGTDSPELGAYRVRAALEQIGVHLSQATCGRLLALHRNLYGLSSSKETAPRERKAMPYKARFRQEYWSVDVRYIEEHNLGFPEPVYLISILEHLLNVNYLGPSPE